MICREICKLLLFTFLLFTHKYKPIKRKIADNASIV